MKLEMVNKNKDATYWRNKAEYYRKQIDQNNLSPRGEIGLMSDILGDYFDCENTKMKNHFSLLFIEMADPHYNGQGIAIDVCKAKIEKIISKAEKEGSGMTQKEVFSNIRKYLKDLADFIAEYPDS